ncbi:MAG: lipopolysaccharide transport periplasmic protein LptA [Proteobacteria bacterium]|nr:lipopolysaccharide transport periplasmic protein LptA [Pseudomonadota bacterium]
MVRTAARVLPLIAALALGSARIAAAEAPGAALQACGQPINLDAASSEVDYKTSTVVFKDVVISQCAMRVSADRARSTGLNFANSTWTFEGNVKIDAEARGNIRSDSAVVEFRDNHIARATVTGKPAEFQQQREGVLVHGHAEEIVYDVNEQTVRLSRDAWLSDGQGEIKGGLLVYSIRAQTIKAESAPGDSGPIHIRIDPHAPPNPGDAGKRPDGSAPVTPKP